MIKCDFTRKAKCERDSSFVRSFVKIISVKGTDFFLNSVLQSKYALKLLFYKQTSYSALSLRSIYLSSSCFKTKVVKTKVLTSKAIDTVVLTLFDFLEIKNKFTVK